MSFATWFMRWFHKLGSPKFFFDCTPFLIRWLGLVSFLLLGTAFTWGLFFAPEDYQQGHSFKIIYVHVPSASLAMSAYFSIAVLGVIGLVWRMKMAFMAAKSIIFCGTIFTFLALVTGAIWGKPTWGTWWSWDARLTSMLILPFLYFGLMLLHSVIPVRERADRSCALLAVIGIVNLPIIKYSVVWWNTLHQPATFALTKKPDMPPEMWLPLLVSLLGFYCFFALCVTLFLRKEILFRESKASWVKDYILNQKYTLRT